MMAAAMEGVGISEFTENVLPHLEEISGQIADVLSRVELPAIKGALHSSGEGGTGPLEPQLPFANDDDQRVRGMLADAARTGIVPDVVSDALAQDLVDCSVFSPPEVHRGETVLIQAFVHRPEAADEARAIARDGDPLARRRAFRSLELPIPLGGRIGLQLRIDECQVEDPTGWVFWSGRTESVQFSASIPVDAAGPTLIATLSVNSGSIPVGHVKFRLMLSTRASTVAAEPQGEVVRRYGEAFVSYASADRAAVLRCVQMLSVVGIRYFADVATLDPGDRWRRRIEAGIDSCDLFLLFWSRRAKQSRLVRAEVRHALARQGGDTLAPPEIRPLILDRPPVSPPWPELRELHFDDRLAYLTVDESRE
jgi:hypothetical protein